MTRKTVHLFLVVSLFSAMPCYGATQGTQPKQSASPATSATIVYDHQQEKGESRIYTREWDDGQSFEVDILNTCPGSFEYEIKGIVAEETGAPRMAQVGEPIEQLSTKTLTGKHESKWGGYFVTIRKQSDSPPCADSGLSDTTLVIKVTTGWQIAAAGGFVFSGLTDPVYSLAPNPDPNNAGNVVATNDKQRDKVKLGLAAFVFVTKKRWPLIPLAFGLGVDGDNRTTYYIGPGIPFGDKAVLTGGLAIGNVSRLPNGMEPGAAVPANSTLDNLPTQTIVRWFFGVSYSFISTGDKLTKPFAGSN
jgi:hypothetical protein